MGLFLFLGNSFYILPDGKAIYRQSAHTEINPTPRAYNPTGDKNMPPKRKRQELSYIFRNPNTNEQILEHLRKVIVNIILNTRENDTRA